MRQRLLITRYQDRLLSALWDGNRVLEFQLESAEDTPQVGDICVGRVHNVVKNISACFVEVQPGQYCFYQMARGESVTIGDIFPVQITREAVKTKMPVCSRSLSLPGRYLVLCSDQCRLSVSTKLDADRRNALREALSSYPEEFGVGFIVRTNAAEADEETLHREAAVLSEQYRRILDNGAHRPCFSLLHNGNPSYLTMLQSAGVGRLEEIVTDEPEVCESVCRYLDQRPEEDRVPVRLYEDAQWPMMKLYRLEHFLELALNKRVWLKSGGYLVIEPTEALTVIDVNTGKNGGHRNSDETFFRTDMEAAEEIALQMRLRNLSGIILIDFIDLADKEMTQKLYEHLEELLRRDPVKTVLVDVTPLHLAEITRKKVRRPLREQIRMQNSDKK